MLQQPLVSILINNYNYGHFLSEAIDSALNQTYPHLEIIVVDDGSVDNSREIITSYKDQIIPVFKENGGQASAFNAGFVASSGEIICLLDSDDLFLPHKVTKIVNILSSSSTTGWCFHALELIDKNLQTIEKAANCNQALKKAGSLVKEYDLRFHLQRGKLNNYIPSYGVPATSGLCFRRSLLEQILPMPEAEKVSLSDNYIKYLALALAKGCVISQPLASQRIHGNNIYTRRKDNQKVTARIAILTAYWLRVKLPKISKFTNNIFASGLTTYWQNGGIEPEFKTMVQKYIKSITWREKLAIYSKSFYYYLKWQI